MIGRYIECDSCGVQKRISKSIPVMTNAVRDVLVGQGWYIASNSRNESIDSDLCPSCKARIEEFGDFKYES